MLTKSKKCKQKIKKKTLKFLTKNLCLFFIIVISNYSSLFLQRIKNISCKQWHKSLYKVITVTCITKDINLMHEHASALKGNIKITAIRYFKPTLMSVPVGSYINFNAIVRARQEKNTLCYLEPN